MIAVPANKNKISNMEIVSFTFGVLSVIAVVFASVIVLSIVKVLKLQQQIKELQNELGHTHTQIFDGDKNIYQRIDRDMEYIHRQLDETRSYIDSRIDKLTASKQLIKG
jgi:5-bromo-4-chloroindolyl phosphate hydrolysis protein